MAIIQVKTEVPEGHINDFYETPIGCALGLCWYLKKTLNINPESILDPGSGTGRFGQAARMVWPDAYIVGVEFDEKMYQPATDWYDYWHTGDYLEYQYENAFDLIIGNPPYGKGTLKGMAQKFLYKSKELLEADGYIAFLLQEAFMHTRTRFDNIFEKYRPIEVNFIAERISFYKSLRGSSTDNTNYVFPIWRKNTSEATRANWISYYDLEEEFLVNNGYRPGRPV